MAGPQSSAPEWKERLKEELSRNKKQTAILGTLLLVGLIVGIRYLKKKPDSAAAAASAVAVQPNVNGAGLLPSLQGPKRTEQHDAYIRQISHDITRDLFELQHELYPIVKPLAPDPIADATGPEGKVGPALEELVRTQAAELTLQSTIDSDIPIAVINGRVLSVGDVIESFRVVKITTGECVIERAGVQVTLKIETD